MAFDTMISSGLEGVVAATTRLSHVDGEAGELLIAGFPVGDLAAHATFEETTWLLWHGDRPTAKELDAFRAELASRRALPPRNARAAPRMRARAHRPHGRAPNRARHHLAHVERSVRDRGRSRRRSSPPSRACRLATSRSSRARDLGHAANYLYMLSGEVPDRRARARSRDISQHGRRPRAQRVHVHVPRDHVHGIGSRLGGRRARSARSRARCTAARRGLRSRRSSRSATRRAPRRCCGRRSKRASASWDSGIACTRCAIRAPTCSPTRPSDCSRAPATCGSIRWPATVESTAIRLLEEYKPGRRLQTNVEFYTALLLHGLGLDVPLFTPTFAISRVSGWIAHAFEQRAANRLIRPKSEYVGPRGRVWTEREVAVGQ